MTYQLRDRPDGLFEIIQIVPVLVGVFPDGEVARKVMSHLSGEGAPVSLPGAGFESEAVTAAVPAPDAGDADDADAMPAAVPPPDLLPTDGSNAAVPLAAAGDFGAAPAVLTEPLKEQAFNRISSGEKIAEVAQDLGLSFAQLRASWAGHCRQLQKHLAEGGQQPCLICQRSFTPSVSNPDTCARCSHDA